MVGRREGKAAGEVVGVDTVGVTEGASNDSHVAPFPHVVVQRASEKLHHGSLPQPAATLYVQHPGSVAVACAVGGSGIELSLGVVDTGDAVGGAVIGANDGDEVVGGEVGDEVVGEIDGGVVGDEVVGEIVDVLGGSATQ